VLGLEAYWDLFEKNSYSEPNALADLKLMDKGTLSTTFEMTKPGHLKKLVKAIKQLKYPTTCKYFNHYPIKTNVDFLYLITKLIRNYGYDNTDVTDVTMK